MQRNALAYHFTILLLGLGLLVEYMLHLMAADGGGGAVRIDPGGRLEGNAGVVGAVLVLALLTGFTASVFRGLLGAVYACCLAGSFRVRCGVQVLDPHPDGHFRRIIAGAGRNTGACQGLGSRIAGNRAGGSLRTGVCILDSEPGGLLCGVALCLCGGSGERYNRGRCVRIDRDNGADRLNGSFRVGAPVQR